MIQVPIIDDTNVLQYTNRRWPDNPFHIGEITLQRFEHQQDNVMGWAPKFLRSYMPLEHRQFYNDLPFLVAAVRDSKTGYMWSTLFENININNNNNNNSNNTVVAISPDSETLHIFGRPAPGDALEHIFDIPDDNDDDDDDNDNNNSSMMIDVGLLGIQFETARRNRVNGRIMLPVKRTTCTSNNDNNSNNINEQQPPLVFKVDLSYGNCPQYIKPRPQWHRATTTSTATTPTSNNNSRSNTTTNKFTNILTPQQIQWIETAETFFTATGYRDGNDNEYKRYYGNDSSHRGGPPGFVRVVQIHKDNHQPNNNNNNNKIVQEILWTEFSGNNMFNSLGNLLLDSRIGLCFPNFITGGLLQITGTAIVGMGPLQFNERQVRMTILAINEVASGSLPIRWGTIDKTTNKSTDATTWSEMSIANIVQESGNVKSFYIRPIDKSSNSSVPQYQGGQHLPIQLKLNNGEIIERRYSISTSSKLKSLNNDNNSNNDNTNDNYSYRISVKHHSKGKSSSYLHEHIKIGDTVKVGKPSGSFVLKSNDEQSPIVLISAGIGITPLLSMLHDHSIAQQTDATKRRQKVYWIHGAKNHTEHPFQEELKDIHNRFFNKESLQIYTLYSKPKKDDVCNDDTTTDSIMIGRITPQYVQQIVNTDLQYASIYLCGPSSFLADMITGLEDDIGIVSTNIFYETF